MFLLLSSVRERGSKGRARRKRCGTAKLTLLWVAKSVPPRPPVRSPLDAHRKQRAGAGRPQRAPDVAARDPSRCGLPGGAGSAPHPRLGRSKGGARRAPALCFDFRGSWALLNLAAMLLPPGHLPPQSCTDEPFLQELRSAELKASRAPLKAGPQGTGKGGINQANKRGGSEDQALAGG